MNKLSFKIAQSGVYQTATQTPNFNARSTDDENHFAQVTSNIIIDDGPESEIDAQDYNQEEEDNSFHIIDGILLKYTHYLRRIRIHVMVRYIAS